MSGPQPGRGWWLGSDGRWYPPEAPGRPEKPRTENTENSSFLKLLKTIQEVAKTIAALLKLKAMIWGGGAIVVVIVIVHITAHHSAYPTAAEQSWMSSCETINNNTPAICGCELSYFEQHVSYQQFEQDYGDMPPGVVPPELANVETCTG